jgi:protein CpxP
MTRKLAALAAILPLLSFAPSALAQPARAQPDQFAALHDALSLTPAQETAWRTYRATVAPDPYATARRKAAAALLPTVPTPQRIALIDAQMQADLDAFRRQGDAVKTFYAALDPVQKRVFDAQTAPRPGPPPAGSPSP